MLVWHNFVARFDLAKRRFVEPRPELWEMYGGDVAYAKGSSNTQEVVPTGPWEGQIPYINQLFQGASNLYQQGPPQYYEGSTVAGPNANVTGSQDSILQYINSQMPTNAAGTAAAGSFAGNAYNNPVYQTGTNVAPQLQGALGQLLAGSAQGAAPMAQGQVGNAGNAYQQALTGSNAVASPNAQGAAGALGGAMAGNSPVSSNMIGSELQKSLGGGALNPYLDQVVQAATRSQVRNFNDSVLPQIGGAAVDAGQSGGAREGVATGIAASRLNEDISDVTARIYGNAFDQGAQERQQALQLSSGMYDSSQARALQGAQTVGSLLDSGANRSLQGATSIGALLNDSARTTVGAQAAGAEIGNNLLQGGNDAAMKQFLEGMGLIQGTQNNQLAQLGTANNIGLQQQGFEQNALNDLVSRWFFDQYAPYNSLSQYQQYITGGYGSSVPVK